MAQAQLPSLELRLLAGDIPQLEAELARLCTAEAERALGAALHALADPARALRERIRAGCVLALLGDPRLDPLAPLLCPVPAGRFWMGTDSAQCDALARSLRIPADWMRKSTPRCELELGGFAIARFPVSAGEYARFAADTDCEELPADWPGRAARPERRNHPVHGVSWSAAQRYAGWLSERSGQRCALPSEAQWEKAARGSDGRAFPCSLGADLARCDRRHGERDAGPTGLRLVRL